MKKNCLSLALVGCLVILTACSKSGNDISSPQTQAKTQSQTVVPVESVQTEEVIEGSEEDIVQTPTWRNFIQSHSEGWQSAESAIELVFKQTLPSEEALPETSLKSLFEIKPAIDFDVRRGGDNKLIVIPSTKLASGQVYQIELVSGMPFSVPESLGRYKFTIQALHQDVDIQISGLEPSHSRSEESGIKNTGKSQAMILAGSIVTHDVANGSDIASMIQVSQEGIEREIEWTHSDDRRNHQFVVTGIQRSEKDSRVTLTWTAKPIGLEKGGEQVIPVPAINQFLVTAVKSRNRPEQFVEISFSEPLHRGQDLTGMVQLNGSDANIRIDGNRLRVFPRGKLSGEVEIGVAPGIKSSDGMLLQKPYDTKVVFISELPSVRYLSKGSIIQPNKQITIPFEAINVNAVWITAFKVFDDNIDNFLQYFDINSSAVATGDGRYLWKKKFSLPDVPRDKWKRYDLDVTELFDKHEDGLLNLSLSIDKGVVIFECEEESEKSAASEQRIANNDGPGNQIIREYPDWYKKYYNIQNGYIRYSRKDREDPCKNSYYQYYGNQSKLTAQKNFLISNVGLIAKRGNDRTLHVVATKLGEGVPYKNMAIEAKNYQHQIVGKGKTNRDGMLTLELSGEPFYVVAKNKKDVGYLRVPRNRALPTNQFDVGGEVIYKGLKGFIYGERDVWRPGDDIHLTFVLNDKLGALPKDHPVTLDLFDPKGVKVKTLVNNQSVGPFYVFKLNTDEQSPTGNWRAVVRLGGEYFDKTLKIETITPNRLKVEVNPAETPIKVANLPVSVGLYAQWLNGAVAANLKVDSEVKLRPSNTSFEGYSQYHFDDLARDFRRSSRKVFTGDLDESGRANFNLTLNQTRNAPGKLSATFVTRVFEKSGEFSKTIRRFDVLPFDEWVGINIPKGDGYRDAISRDKDHDVNFIAIDTEGTPLKNKEIEITVHRLGWRWWWDQSEDNIANYVRRYHHDKRDSAVVTTDEQGKATWTLKKDTYNWGRHLVRACHRSSSHCSSKEVYLGWSWSNQVNPDSATQLVIATDKKKYQVGDVAIIKIPELKQGRVLYSLETSSKVIRQQWLDLKPGARSFEIPVTEDMAPNAYVNVTLLLPNEARESDAPIRMYGITPIIVDNPESHLKPEITASDVVRPESSFSITVAESQGRKMHYTLAMVDEGLLGLTGFKAPNPHKEFYKREALGVQTWDLYDGVIGAYGANLERLLNIGGGKKGKNRGDKKQRRFPPVVKFLGAFSVEPGETKEHKITLPQYMGAVRIMVVAAEGDAYGKAEKTITVTQPVTLLATLPRVLGPEETVSLPVNVFVNDKRINKVKITAEAELPYQLEIDQQTLVFDKPGDKIAMLSLKVLDQLGVGAITVRAEGEYTDENDVLVKEHAEQTIHIESRSPNVATSTNISKLLKAGEMWSPELVPHGLAGTNNATVAVSSLPPLNLEERMRYLIRYPHGCLEQTTSAVFPQIWLHELTNLSKKQRDDIQLHVNEAIQKYRRFQRPGGGFSYWPGQNYSNDWASVYATHFLVEAKKQGYAVSIELYDTALKNLKEAASAYSPSSRFSYGDEVAAYRLYVLSLAGKADLAAMNRLRNQINSDKKINASLTRWLLVLSYQLIGLPDVAEEIMYSNANDYGRSNHYTYGSDLRDRSMRMMTYALLENEAKAWSDAEVIAKALASRQWYSTQSTAWALMALSTYANKKVTDDANEFSLRTADSDTWQQQQSLNYIFQQTVPTHSLAKQSLAIRNDSEHPLYVFVNNVGVPKAGGETESSSTLKMDVNFTDLKGNAIEVNKLPQGQDFKAVVTVTTDKSESIQYKIEDVALSMVMASGWQIRNQRLEGDTLNKALDYQDIRDDRVMSYFSLWNRHYWHYRYSDQTQDQITIEVVLNASYAGKFYLPGWTVAAMYDDDIKASTKGQWVEVVKQ